MENSRTEWRFIARKIADFIWFLWSIFQCHQVAFSTHHILEGVIAPCKVSVDLGEFQGVLRTWKVDPKHPRKNNCKSPHQSQMPNEVRLVATDLPFWGALPLDPWDLQKSSLFHCVAAPLGTSDSLTRTTPRDGGPNLEFKIMSWIWIWVNYYTGWWLSLPLWKIYESIGMIIINIWKNTSHVPNHQPDYSSLTWI